MDDLARIISEIGAANDSAEQSRWQVCKLIEAAYAECGAYERGLTAGLCSRLRKSSDSVYNMRNAEILRNVLNVSEILPPSHFWTLYRLRERYALTDDSCREWLALAESENLSVRDMSSEIEAAHVKSQRVAWMRHVKRLGKLAARVWTDAEAAGLPEAIRPLLTQIYEDVNRFTVELEKWKPLD
jgi:hypothetical protein